MTRAPLFLCLTLLALPACSGDGGTDPGPDPTAASVQVEAITYLGEFGDGDHYDVTFRNHGNQPGVYKVQAWGHHPARPDDDPAMWGETTPVTVDGDFEESTELTVGNRTAWILVFTRPAAGGDFARTDSVHVDALK
jgi:hypothetical protein